MYIINYNLCAIVYTDNRKVAGKISSVHIFLMCNSTTNVQWKYLPAIHFLNR